MSKRGRLEAQFTFSSALTGTVTDSNGGPTAWSVAAGSYYFLELVAAFQAALIAATGAVGNNFTVTVSDGESGTGKCTITTTDNPWSIAFTSTSLRDILGFTGNITNVNTAQTGTNHCIGLWLPDVPMIAPHGADDGTEVAGTRVKAVTQTVSPTGAVWSFVGSGFEEYRGIRWEGVSRARTKIIGEDVANESFEYFLEQCIWNGSGYFTAYPKMRLYWDADTDGTYTICRLVGLPEFEPQRFADTWVGRYIVELPRLVVTT